MTKPYTCTCTYNLYYVYQLIYYYNYYYYYYYYNYNVYGLCQSNSRVSIVLCEVGSHGYQEHYLPTRMYMLYIMHVYIIM